MPHLRKALPPSQRHSNQAQALVVLQPMSQLVLEIHQGLASVALVAICLAVPQLHRLD